MMKESYSIQPAEEPSFDREVLKSLALFSADCVRDPIPLTTTFGLAQ